MQFPCSTSVHCISFDIKDIHQKSQLSRVTKTIVPEKHVTCIIAQWRTGVNKFQEQLGAVYQNHPQERKVYAAKSFVTVLDQEGGVVPSDGVPNPLNA